MTTKHDAWNLGYGVGFENPERLSYGEEHLGWGVVMRYEPVRDTEELDRAFLEGAWAGQRAAAREQNVTAQADREQRPTGSSTNPYPDKGVLARARSALAECYRVLSELDASREPLPDDAKARLGEAQRLVLMADFQACGGPGAEAA